MVILRLSRSLRRGCVALPLVAALLAPTAAVGDERPVPEHLFGSAIRTMPTQEKVVALTFNAAWNDEGLDAVLSVLREEKASATFFPTGDFAERLPDAVRRIAAAGHGLGNHSHTHPHFGSLTPAGRAAEVNAADDAVRVAAGTEPLPFFRFPYGDTTPTQIAEVNSLGYADIEWTTDTNGYLGPAGGMTVEKVVDRALAALTPGEIIQMHVGQGTGQGPVLDADALPEIIDAVRARGYEIVDLRTLLTAPAAPAVTQQRDAGVLMPALVPWDSASAAMRSGPGLPLRLW
ncbi:polysaccharide deacetylase family protein [Streptomyces sp. NPDC047108]|uniref:polysaccharide deacetylase family protein n=1 Tax=Streptomyces sp. NPDC047108 TaxID=3155025 RepID=UPI0033C984FD